MPTLTAEEERAEVPKRASSRLNSFVRSVRKLDKVVTKDSSLTQPEPPRSGHSEQAPKKPVR